MERYLKNVLRSSNFSGVGENRSRTMAAIRSKGNRTTELKLRMAMVRAGIGGWTMHRKDIVGTPDFFFQKRRLAVFVDGCFWHGCPSCGHTPKTRSRFWAAKLQRNKTRDLVAVEKLKDDGIRTLRIWEHDLKSHEDRDTAVRTVCDLLGARNRNSSRKDR
ncbi:MAG: very short patch repair endonuclease [Acidobacteriaceae bacterium]|jgi:DNA mismatch endonuclease (patch repair protein)